MRIRSVRRMAVIAGFLLSLASSRADALDADSADDVCAPNADPCNVTETVHVASSATLDFGTRTVSVSGNGKFDFGRSSGRVLCGPFQASTSGNAIVAAGHVDGGGTDSGTVTIQSRRSCSAGDPQAPCLDSEDCRLGACAARRCSGNPARTCQDDANCTGLCTNRRCSNTSVFTRCTTDAQCDFGTCPAELTCSNYRYSPRNCSADADCQLGECTIGEGSLSISGGILGKSNSPALIRLQASDSVTLDSDIDLSGTAFEADGGSLDIEASQGNVTIAGRIRAVSGGEGQGGDVKIEAGRDVAISAPIDLDGGDYDGGYLAIESGRDVTLDAGIRANSRRGSGFGGEIYVENARHLTIGGGPDPMRLMVNGHHDAEGGDAGYFNFYVGGDLRIESNVRMIGVGRAPLGFGAYTFAEVDGSFTFNGELLARTRGHGGAGGQMEIAATGPISVGDTAKIDIRGGTYGGGIATLTSYEASADVAGTWLTNGSIDEGYGSFDLEACNIRFAGNVQNKSDEGETFLIAHESMQVVAGSVLNTPNGENRLIYRTDEKLPVVAGTVSPAPIFDIWPLAGCRYCGNSEIEDGETCDDGNTAAGDGCGSDCLLEQ